MNFFIFSISVFVSLCFFSFPISIDVSTAQDPLKLILGSPNFGSWKSVISPELLAPGPSVIVISDYLVLAADITKRPDILKAFKPYHGGWNVTNTHYWASVGFTGAHVVILAIVWILSFGSLLV